MSGNRPLPRKLNSWNIAVFIRGPETHTAINEIAKASTNVIVRIILRIVNAIVIGTIITSPFVYTVMTSISNLGKPFISERGANGSPSIDPAVHEV
jgi:hypothetical protein